MVANTNVRVTEEDGSTSEGSLWELRREHHLDEEELRSILAGDRVTFGGGEGPVFHVEIAS